MIDTTGTMDVSADQPTLGSEPGSWSMVTGTLPSNLPAANTPGNPAVQAAMAGTSTTSTSTATKVAIGLGVAAVVLGLLVVATSKPRR